MFGIGEEALGMVYGGRRCVWKDVCLAILGETVDGSWIELHCSLFAELQVGLRSGTETRLRREGDFDRAEITMIIIGRNPDTCLVGGKKRHFNNCREAGKHLDQDYFDTI